ncbi:exodeoxyribonuclease VII large subunit [Loktanella sp. D2R18]|uniref:exodeoxyribonuclease VII large subunit n=1 Tax=Rhodobacterales TaxID=204455 RepID=UPI000DEA8BA2|nr:MULTISPECIES: exodeoxyribonuclease VII large subunit [Rhodobacterales]MDO6590273.1 exodeoxyribonuclease VII large subunit [Yoonia sp. 1_MG-2023]RBW42918.1 exodeoxyribonuclease VII large subunit [Loktanella sp. D2R18]
MDLFDDGPADNTPEFSVSELSGAVKKAIEGGFSHVRVRGEVGRVSRPGSGHIYLDLKDDRSVLSGVIWKGRAQGLAHRPEEGMEVVATGKLTTFPGQSKYQMIIEDIAPAGAGALMAMLEKRKAALAAEGLFAPDRKQPLPYLPGIIGVITSPSGAVIRDILHRLRDRFPRKVLVWPVAVQGQRCAPDVAAAIEGFNRLTPGGALPRPDLLIVARGGGSLEDLWGFNEEIVARAAAASDIPLISAVGHETDTTLIDFVSDMRAPTPTAAAELAVPVRMELLAWADQQAARLNRALTTGVSQRQQRVRDLGRALPRKDSLLNVPTQRLDHLADRLPAALKTAAAKKRLQLSEASLRPGILNRRIAEDRRRLSTLCTRLTPGLLEDRITRQSERLAVTMTRLSDRATRQQTERAARLSTLDRMHETLGYKATLARGYAVVHGADGLVTRAAGAKGPLEIEFTDGRVSTIAK